MVANRKIVESAKLSAALGFGMAVFSGCSVQPSLYRWGEYEPLLYQMYAEEGEHDAGAQLARLSEDVERTLAEGQLVPPGVHAHLGYLYYTQGDTQAAPKQFVTEKELFPESSVFIDGIMKRLARKK